MLYTLYIDTRSLVIYLIVTFVWIITCGGEYYVSLHGTGKHDFLLLSLSLVRQKLKLIHDEGLCHLNKVWRIINIHNIKTQYKI